MDEIGNPNDDPNDFLADIDAVIFPLVCPSCYWRGDDNETTNAVGLTRDQVSRDGGDPLDYEPYGSCPNCGAQVEDRT